MVLVRNSGESDVLITTYSKLCKILYLFNTFHRRLHLLPNSILDINRGQ